MKTIGLLGGMSWESTIPYYRLIGHLAVEAFVSFLIQPCCGNTHQERGMKTIGLLGGMSWESTIPYYRLINEGIKQRLGGLHSAQVLLHSVDFHGASAAT